MSRPVNNALVRVFSIVAALIVVQLAVLLGGWLFAFG